MKARTITQKDIQKFNEIDNLTSSEFLDEETAAAEISHDGVEITIPGSELDNFPDDDDTEIEEVGGQPGEISSSDNEDDDQSHRIIPTVKSKVVKNAAKTTTPKSRLEKFNHLRQDPDFRMFINEVVDERMKSDKKSGGTSSSVNANQSKRQETHQPRRPLQAKTGQTPTQVKTGQIVQSRINHSGGMPNIMNCKSPSDTTLYSPGLRMANVNSNDEISIIDKISNFVENIRIDSR